MYAEVYEETDFNIAVELLVLVLSILLLINSGLAWKGPKGIDTRMNRTSFVLGLLFVVFDALSFISKFV